MKAIDLFAGAGGFTTGAEQAGVSVLWAANHWQSAVDVHRANHPHVAHACQDLHQADWSKVPSMDVVLASPACQGHSRARGKHHPRGTVDQTRSTAWAVVSCVEYHRPRFWVVENVSEFKLWRLLPAWRLAMESLGYSLSEQTINAADVGVPQHRRRLFVVGTLGRVALTLPQPTQAHVSARSILDLDGGRWGPVVKPGRSPNTLAKVRGGWERYGDEPFLIAFYGNSTKPISIDKPIGTITTRDRYAVVQGDRMRMLTVAECRRAMGFPDDYQLPTQKRLAVHLLGNAVVPGVAEYVLNTLRELG